MARTVVRKTESVVTYSSNGSTDTASSPRDSYKPLANSTEVDGVASIKIKKKVISKSAKSGLVFPVSRVLRYMRRARLANVVQVGKLDEKNRSQS